MSAAAPRFAARSKRRTRAASRRGKLTGRPVK
jgi:hypothetical protein